MGPLFVVLWVSCAGLEVCFGCVWGWFGVWGRLGWSWGSLGCLGRGLGPKLSPRLPQDRPKRAQHGPQKAIWREARGPTTSGNNNIINSICLVWGDRLVEDGSNMGGLGALLGGLGARFAPNPKKSEAPGGYDRLWPGKGDYKCGPWPPQSSEATLHYVRSTK